MDNIFASTSFQDKRKYLLNQIVIIVKEYSLFGLSKIRYYNDNEEFIIDSKLLTEEPIEEHTINIRLLGGIPCDT